MELLLQLVNLRLKQALVLLQQALILLYLMQLQHDQLQLQQDLLQDLLRQIYSDIASTVTLHTLI